MKVAVFYPESLYSAWSVSEGIVDTLKRMGHDALNCGVNPKSQTISRSQYPKIEELNECDAVLVSGPEHLGKYLTELYPGFQKLKAKRLAWMHETVEREDYGKLPIEGIKRAFDKVFTPAAQDEKYGMTFLPFGVDTEMFSKSRHDKRYDAVFIGAMYGPRAEFVKKHQLQNAMRFGKCEGLSVRSSAEIYASELKKSRVLVNLPSLCRHAVTKIFEGAACGAAVVTEALEDTSNHVLKAARYYQGGDGLKMALSDLAMASDSDTVASLQWQEIQAEHRLDQRLRDILQ